MSGQIAVFARRGWDGIDWSARWPSRADWYKACAIGALIGVGLGVNPQVWPWHMIAVAPRTVFWLSLSLLTAIQWVAVASLLPVIGTAGWLQRTARPIIILLLLAPCCGIEYAVLSRLVGLLPGLPFADLATSFAWQSIKWGAVLVLPLALVINWRQEHNASARELTSQNADRNVHEILPTPAPADVLREKLPPTLRGRIIALKAEDHYVRVFTERGDALVLARFADVVSSLGDKPGFQTHRSYWVRKDAIEDVIRDGRQCKIKLMNGCLVPVSRAYANKIRAYVPYSSD